MLCSSGFNASACYKFVMSSSCDFSIGLRSGKLGEQCEAVVRFPRLFQKYPFPILINSAFLKLADVFRVGNNFLRLCVLKVTQQSEKHLEKILNVDEFVKRVFSVIHSNDPVARAITLRMLGSLASIIPERKNAHHSIRQSLDSHDNVEVEAAVFAAANFSAQSKDFAVGICNKISEMIQGLATPVDLKLQLIPILQHMHHDAILASSARQLLQQLVTSYPSTRMVIVSLHTFTLLAASSLVDTPKQIQLLLQYLKSDPRRAVKRLAVQDLKLLASKTPHTWSKENMQALCECALQTPYDSLKLGMLSVLSTLSGTIAIKHYFSAAPGNVGSSPRSSDLVKLAQECCYHSNRGIAAHGVRVLTNITVSCQEKDLLSLEQDAVFGLESLLVLCSQDDSPGAQSTVKIALNCMVKLAKGRPHLSRSVVDTLLTQLHSSQDTARVLMCHCLAAIAMQLPVLGDGMLGDLVELYKVIGRSATDKQQELLVSLATVIFVASQKALSSEVKAVIKQQLDSVSSGWTVYRIARQASRMGNHDMARELYQSLLTQVASEHFYFWLNSLKEFSHAEQCLTGLQEESFSSALSCIAESLKFYHKGIASLTAASTPLNPLSFQCEFVKLRIDLLQAFSQLICTCNSLKTSPPPAIATTIAMTLGNDLQRCGRISNQACLNSCPLLLVILVKLEETKMQMKQSMEEFRSLASRYRDLYQTSFDADSATLRNVELQQQSCLLIAHAIEALVLDPESASFQEYGSTGTAHADSEYERRMMAVYSHVLEEVESLNRKYAPVSYMHTACLCNAIIALLKVPLSFQRYFFQKLQSTSIKLALSPSPRNPAEPIAVQNNQQLALKVEGVVQHGSKPGLFRRIQSVCLSVSSTLQSKSSQDFKIPIDSITNEMEQRVEPHNDYFSTQFLLNFAVLGTHSITVESSVRDANGIVWKTGPRTTMFVKSLEDPYSQQIRLQQQQAQQPLQPQPQPQPRSAYTRQIKITPSPPQRLLGLIQLASSLKSSCRPDLVEHTFNAAANIRVFVIVLEPGSLPNVCGVLVMEWGEDIKAISNDEAVMLVNHQATGDVCTLMMCLQDKGPVVAQMMWLMDHIFKYTNFGIVSLIHGDFFIRQGRSYRDQQLLVLKKHLEQNYRSRDRKWIVLFPEGGFLRKRRETSQAFAKKNNLPFLTHVTLPRFGATNIILNALVARQENGSPAGGDARGLRCKPGGLQWIIDTTIAYPNAEPVDIQTWILGYRKPTVTHVHYRIFPIKDVPLETDDLTSWLYQRFIEKEDLLSHFYKTGAFPPAQGHKEAVSREMTLSNTWIFLIQSFAFLSGYLWFHVFQYFYHCLF
ncbi:integrator complex subunit 7 [Cricetulus griseus]|nr:integrator complex subunit 7 [Cricetulus griseus]